MLPRSIVHTRLFPLLASVLVLGTLMLSACGSSTGAGTLSATLTYWATNPSMQAAVAQFNQAHKNIQVTMVTQSDHDIAGKLTQAIQAGQAPDVADVPAFDVPDLARQGLLTSYDVPSDYSRLYAYVALGRWYFKYGIPVDIDPLVVFYNKALVSQLHFAQEPLPHPWFTYDELATLATSYHTATGKALVNVDFKGTPALFSALVGQQQGTWFQTDDGKAFTVTVNSPQTQAVATYWDGLIQSGAASTMDLQTVFQQGTTPLVIAPLSSVATLKATGAAAQWGVAFDDDYCGTAVPHFRIWPHPPRHDVQEALEEFMSWMATNSASLKAQLANGVFPATTAAYALPEASQLDTFYGIPGLAQLAGNANAATTTTFQFGPNMRSVYSDFEALYAQTGTLAGTLSQLQTDTVKNLATSAAG